MLLVPQGREHEVLLPEEHLPGEGQQGRQAGATRPGHLLQRGTRRKEHLEYARLVWPPPFTVSPSRTKL